MTNAASKRISLHANAWSGSPRHSSSRYRPPYTVRTNSVAQAEQSKPIQYAIVLAMRRLRVHRPMARAPSHRRLHHLEEVSRPWTSCRKKGRHGLLSNHTRDCSLTAPPICAFAGRRAKRHGWLRLQGDMNTLVPVVASLAHRGKAQRKGVKHEPPVIGAHTCCKDRQEAKRLAQSTPPSCAAAAQ